MQYFFLQCTAVEILCIHTPCFLFFFNFIVDRMLETKIHFFCLFDTSKIFKIILKNHCNGINDFIW
jgi:hypothetical protein